MSPSIDPQVLSLLCDPFTKEPLQLAGDALRDQKSGRVYPIRNGIPVLLGDVAGDNKKYQQLYDRIAFLYDPSLAVARWFIGDFRGDYLDQLEVKSGDRVLEVSIGTGDNIHYLPQDIDTYGIDLSAGMLRRCSNNLSRWRRRAALIQAEGEHLPFRDECFDVVFHVGGINFFSDKARAIREMIRVARPGSKLLIVDETERVVVRSYQRIPIVRRYFQARTSEVKTPIGFVPPEMQELRSQEFFGGRLYCITFRKPERISA